MPASRHHEEEPSAPPPPLTVAVVTDGPNALLELAGELDLSTVDELRRAGLDAIGAGARDVAVDCAALTFIDSTGLSGLIELVLALDQVDGRLVVRNPSRVLVSLIRATGLRDVLVVEAGSEPPDGGATAEVGGEAATDPAEADPRPLDGRARALRPGWLT